MLIGRHTAIEQVRHGARRLAEGLPTLVEVVAEPGMGKSTLLTELESSLAGHTVLRARAMQFERAVPCAVLAKALESAGLDDRLGTVVEHLVRIDGGTAGIPRYEAYRAVRRVLLELAEASGVAVLLDDVHWADGDSVALLEYLLSTMPVAGVLVAVTYRPRQASSALIDALGTPGATLWRERVELRPLTAEDSLALLQALGAPEHLATAGAGNPLYLLALAHEGEAVGNTVDVAGWLRAALLSDVDSASVAARLLARSAAVVGDPFDPDVAVEISGLDLDSAVAALDELHRRDVVRPESGKSLQFRHPVVWRMIYDNAPPAWRWSAHRSAIAALRRRGASLLAQAVHVERCAGTGDADAVEVLLEAADLAGPRAPASAARWLRSALALMPQACEGAPDRLARHLQLARYLILAGRFTEAHGVLRELAVPPDPGRTEVVVLQVMVDRLLGRHNDGRRRLVNALAGVAPGTGPYARLSVELATVELMEGTVTPHTVSLAEQALGTGVDAALRTWASAVAAVGSLLLGDVGGAFDHCDAAARGLDGLSDEELGERLDACLWTGWAEMALARLLVGVAHFDRGIALARHKGQAHLQSHLLAGRAICLRWLGRLGPAAQDAEEAVDAARLCHSDELLALSMCTRAWIEIHGGDLTSARSAAEAVVGLSGPDTGWWATMAGFVAATAQAEAGEAGPAGRRLLAVGGGELLPRVDPQGRPAWYERLVRAAAADGDRAAAARWAERATGAADDRLAIPTGLAALARAQVPPPGDPEARRDAQRAVELFTDVGAALESAQATFVLAMSTTPPSAARALFDLAAERFNACGATRSGDQARRQGRNTGGTAVLSPRELEVTELVSRGLRNREIAKRLFVTEKTVETHLSRIFTKLDLSSRTALAAWLVATRE